MRVATFLLAQTTTFPPVTTTQEPPGLIDIAIIVLAFLLALGIAVFVLYLLYDALRAIPPEYRSMEPGQVWLMLIPLFNLVWVFFVTQRIPESYQRFFNSRGRYDVGDAGKSLGLWYAICTVCSIIPCLGFFTALAGLVLLILFLVKITGLKAQVPQLLSMPVLAAPNPYPYAATGGFPVGAPPPPPPPVTSPPPPQQG